jgi:4-methyl-5(b-hydroxyethyl)-thiazole monophosphate biosynthesis
MAKVYEFLANGFEEVEALAPVDILRRGGVEIVTVSVNGSQMVDSSHGVSIKADVKFEDIKSFDDADMLIIPGGMPGSVNLNEHEGVRNILLEQYNKGKRIGAICAAPMVLGSIGLLNGKRATCSPGFEKYMTGAEYTHELFTVDGRIITGEGPAATLPYAYKILSFFIGDENTRILQHKMQYLHLIGEE